MIADVSNFCAPNVNVLLFGDASLQSILIGSFSVQPKSVYKNQSDSGQTMT